MELNTPYWVQVNQDIAEAVDENSIMLAVRTIVQDNLRTGARFAQVRMVQVRYNGDFSAALTRRAWYEARETIDAWFG